MMTRPSQLCGMMDVVRRVGRVRIVSLASVLMLLPAAAGAAAPPEQPQSTQGDGEEEVESAEEIALEQAKAIERKRQIELYDRGSKSYEAGDFVGAIGPWQELYDTVPLRSKLGLFTQLADAHWEAYQTDRDEDHLDKAKAMLERNLEHTYGNEGAQRETQEQLDAVNAELERLADARAQQQLEDAERKAVAEEQARRGQEDLEDRQARLEEERRRFGVHVKVGGSLAGVGVLSLAMAAVGLGLGAGVDREGAKLFANPDARPEEFQDLLGKGRAYNRLAVATGTLGGALVVSGATVVLVAALRLRRVKGETQTQARVVPGVLGMEVRF